MLAGQTPGGQAPSAGQAPPGMQAARAGQGAPAAPSPPAGFGVPTGHGVPIGHGVPPGRAATSGHGGTATPGSPGGPGSPARLARAVLAVPAALLALIAGLSFDGAFDLGDILPICVLSAAVPALIAAAARLRRARPVPLPLTIAVSAAAWLALLPSAAGRLAAHGAAASPGAVEILRSGLTNAPKQLLTTALPAVPTAPLLLALGTLVWWASAWSAEAAVRGSAPLLPALAPALVVFAGTAAGVPRGSAAQLWPAAAFLAVLAFLLAAQRALRRARPAGDALSGLAARGVRVALAVAVVAAVTGVAVALTPLLPGLESRPPADPRQLVTPPSHVESLLDPLSAVTAWLSGPVRPLLSVQTADPVNLRWLVLDRYDGAQWTSSADYVPAGQQLPPAAQVTVATSAVRDNLRLGDLPGTWLPAPDRPASVTGIAARVDPASGVLATLDGAPARGRGYQVTSDVPQPRLGELESAVPGNDPALAAQRTLPPGLPGSVAAYGTSATAGAGYPYQEMVLLQDRLLRDFRYDAKAAPGESYGHLVFFVSRRAGGPAVFATLFAVLARHAGFPSRIAVGFSPGRRTGAGRYLVTTADALIWPEVYFRGLGWVPFYPLPSRSASANGQDIRSLGQPRSSSALDQQVARSTTGSRGRPRPSAQVRVTPPAAQRHTARDAGLWLLAAVGVLGGCYLAAAAVARAMTRRRWRREPDPRRRVAGAWQETLGRLATAGGGPLSSLTPDEVVTRGVRLLGDPAGPPLMRLAGLVNAALFGARPPAPGDADLAWSAAAQVRRLARRHTRWRARAAAALRLAPARYDRAGAGSRGTGPGGAGPGGPGPGGGGYDELGADAGTTVQTGLAAAVFARPSGDSTSVPTTKQ
jgi:transglutaminase-like putative cysteine protease